MLLRLDATTLDLDPWSFPASSGFQGPVVIAADGEAVVAYHTSTPVASTHLFHYHFDERGEPRPVQDATLVDAFEEITELPTNASRSLLALPVTCPAGFCLGGAGISFVATSPTAVAPRLPVSELGLAPAFVLFK